MVRRILLVISLILMALSIRPAASLAAEGTYPLGVCLGPTHATMGPGQAVQAPEYFDPATAGDAELACYGFKFPTDPTARRAWDNQMGKLHVRTWVRGTVTMDVGGLKQRRAAGRAGSRPGFYGGPPTAGAFVGNWSGWVAVPGSADNHNNFNVVGGSFIQPSYVATDAQQFSEWVGLGGLPGVDLYQDGGIIKNPVGPCGSSACYTMFYERINAAGTCCDPADVSKPADVPGHSYQAIVIEEDNGSTQYTLVDNTTSVGVAYYDQHSDTSSPTAEFIVEDPSAKGSTVYCPFGGSNCWDGKYPITRWGPQSSTIWWINAVGGINMNGAEEDVDRFPLSAFMMGINTGNNGGAGGPAYDEPTSIVTSGSNESQFNSCPKTVPANQITTWTPPPLATC